VVAKTFARSSGMGPRPGGASSGQGAARHDLAISPAGCTHQPPPGTAPALPGGDEGRRPSAATQGASAPAPAGPSAHGPQGGPADLAGQPASSPPDDVADLALRIHHSRVPVVPLADVAFRLRQAGHQVTLDQVHAAVSPPVTRGAARGSPVR
jgi:hypothetical protein